MICVSEVRNCGTLNLGATLGRPRVGWVSWRPKWDSARRTLSPLFVAMGAILSFFFPWEDTGPDTRDTKEDEGGVKEVDKDTPDIKKTPEMTAEANVSVPKITEEAMEEADYEVVETSCDPAGFPRTPQNSFANLPSLPAGQLDDGFEVISQRAEEPTSLLNVDNSVENDEEESPIASLKSGVEALLTDLAASAGPEQEEESTTTTSSSVVKEETSTTTTNVAEEVQSIGEVQEETKTEETMDL